MTNDDDAGGAGNGGDGGDGGEGRVSPDVKCVASPCVYWMPGDRCGAAGIDVRDERGDKTQQPGDKTQQPEDTECHTFALRQGVTSMVSAAGNVNWGGMATELLRAGRQLEPEVTCSVDDCRFWAVGNRCRAGAIEVAGRDADQSPDTSCATFER